ncbi:intein-containing DNA gyrase subunit A [soil metagenome]
MSDVTPPDQPAVETFEPVEIEEELQRSYIDYAMSVIVGRALPHVRDGLKPVHRRILFSMWEGGMRAGTQHRKSAAAVGDVMKKYHPHGDSSIYDALVRMAQPWAIRYPLIQGHGNFGSVDGDPPAAMRYCVTGDTRVRLADGSHQRIDSLAGDRSGTDLDLDLKVENHLGEPVRATRWFDSGFHDVHEVTTREGFRLRATENHPLLVATAPLGVPMLSWKLVNELKPGDRVVLRRGTSDDVAHVDEDTYLRGTRLGKESHDKRIPESVWQGSPGLQRVFLQSLFTGDGSRSILGGNAIQISYSTRSDQLARDVQTMALAFGMVMRRVDYASGEIKLVVSSRREARLRPWVHTDWLRRHNVDRRERWDTDAEGVRARIHDPEMLRVIEPLIDPGNYYAEVTAVEHLGLKPVYSLRVDSGDHAFVTDGFVSHNTEARLSPLAMELLRDIEEDTVEFVDSYDGSEEEPVVLPSRFPNLLVNGSAGIAVGMATNVAPHNLNEIIDAIVAQIADPDIDLDQLMEIVPGPDFPTGALIMGVTPIREAYETGRGSIRMRAIVEVEESATGERLVATELPYQVNKANLAVKIAELVKSGRLGGIRDIRDESNRQGNRLVIELKRDANAQVVLNQLYKMTQLQDTFGVINLSLVSTDTDEQSHTGVPRTMGLKDTIAHYITHQIQIITRRTEYRLRKARERSHVLEGLIVALDNLDDVIALIRNSASADDALGELQQRYELSEIQARAILDLPLRRLAALERQRIQEEYAELQARIVELEDILADPQRIRNIIVEELTEIRDKFGDARRTRILPGEGDLDIEDLIPEEQMVVTITQGGYIKRVKATEYRTQRRGGKGISAGGLKDEDIIWDLFSTSTHHWVLFFTSTGRMHRIKAWQIPEKSRTARGVYLANVPGLELEKDEFVRTIVHLENLQEEGRYLLFTTRNGIVKRTRLEEYDSPRSTLIAIGLRDGDELIDVRLTNGTDEVLLVSKKAQSIRFVEDDARAMGRGASGVKGMDLADDDEVLACALAQEEGYLVVITDEGFGKRTPLERYPSQKRGGKGVKTARLSDNRGGLVGALVAGYEQEILVVTDKGTIIRMDVKDVRPTGRATQGVRIMSTAAGAKVVSVAKVMELQVLELEGDADDDQDE